MFLFLLIGLEIYLNTLPGLALGLFARTYVKKERVRGWVDGWFGGEWGVTEEAKGKREEDRVYRGFANAFCILRLRRARRGKRETLGYW